jgi:hypothetical protein
MRTTIDLDEDVLSATKSLSQQRGLPMGKVVSELVRRALRPASAPRMRNGVPLFPLRKTGNRPGLELVNQLRDEE